MTMPPLTNARRLIERSGSGSGVVVSSAMDLISGLLPDYG
jgi:hypothetical protein